jgi:hypothetical protein
MMPVSWARKAIAVVFPADRSIDRKEVAATRQGERSRQAPGRRPEEAGATLCASKFMAL